MRWLTRLAAEPLVHFFLLGAAVFGWFAVTSEPEPASGGNRIVIPYAQLERATLAWTQRSKRPPDPQEAQGILDEVIREEVLYREALALGLDRDDVVIRSLLRQKFEFVTQDLGFDAEPDEAVLRDFHAKNADRYLRAARLSFSQILFSTDRRGAEAETDAQRALADLRADQGPGGGPGAAEELGDGGALAPSYRDLADFEIAAIFGPDFSAAIQSVGPGRWSDPIASGFGLHLVWIDQRTPGATMPFEEVADRVRDDWTYEQRRVSNDAIFQKLRDRYEITVEPAPAADGGADGS